LTASTGVIWTDDFLRVRSKMSLQHITRAAAGARRKSALFAFGKALIVQHALQAEM
jgi:hypothetical protein